MAEETVDLGANINFELHIHPLVITQILDFYYRKLGAQKLNPDTLVAGALLGTVYTNKVHVTNAFAVYVVEDAEQGYALDLAESKEIYHLHQQANPNEVLLGAFVTTQQLDLEVGVAYFSTEYSKKENGFNATAVLGQPIILKIDPTLESNSINMRAFKLNQSLKHYAAVASFNTLPIKVSFSDETIQQAAPFLRQNLGQKDVIIANTQSPQQLVQESVKNIEKILQYIERVIDGSEEGNQTLGRSLLSALNKIDLDQELITHQIEEAQLFQFLSNFAHNQSLANEKLQKL